MIKSQNFNIAQKKQVLEKYLKLLICNNILKFYVSENYICVRSTKSCYRTDMGGGWMIYYYRKDPPLCSGSPPPCTRFSLPAARERCPLMPESGEKERDIYLKSYTNLRVMI